MSMDVLEFDFGNIGQHEIPCFSKQVASQEFCKMSMDVLEFAGGQ